VFLHIFFFFVAGQWSWIQVFPIIPDFGPAERANPLFILVGSLFFMWGGDVSAYDSLAGPMWLLDTTGELSQSK